MVSWLLYKPLSIDLEFSFHNENCCHKHRIDLHRPLKHNYVSDLSNYNHITSSFATIWFLNICLDTFTINLNGELKLPGLYSPSLEKFWNKWNLYIHTHLFFTSEYWNKLTLQFCSIPDKADTSYKTNGLTFKHSGTLNWYRFLSR